MFILIMSDKITLKFDVRYDEIEHLRRDKKRNTIIELRNGDRITFSGKTASRIYKKLCKNFDGEHLN